MTIEEISGTLIEVTKHVLKKRGITHEIDIKNPLTQEGLGLDSIGRLTLLTEIERKFKINFPEDYWGSMTFESLSAIIQFIDEHQ